MRKLTRIKQIQALEATARHGSFVGASHELGITPAAVGQLVRSLESWIGYPLFKRSRSGRERLEPLEQTRRALHDIAAGLDRLEAGVDKLREGKRRTAVIVTASQAFVANWLLARLSHFSVRHPHIDVHLDVSDRLVDLLHEEADLGIRFGSGRWPGLISSLLMNEEIIAVCSSALPPDDAGNWLRQAPLIHNVTRYARDDIPGWRDWFRVFDPAHEVHDQRLQINSTAAVIQAALAGRGIALVRRALAEQHIASGKLHRLWPERSLPITLAYFVVATRRSLLRPEVKIFHGWLLEQARATAAPAETGA